MINQMQALVAHCHKLPRTCCIDKVQPEISVCSVHWGICWYINFFPVLYKLPFGWELCRRAEFGLCLCSVDNVQVSPIQCCCLISAPHTCEPLRFLFTDKSTFQGHPLSWGRHHTNITLTGGIFMSLCSLIWSMTEGASLRTHCPAYRAPPRKEFSADQWLLEQGVNTDLSLWDMCGCLCVFFHYWSPFLNPVTEGKLPFCQDGMTCQVRSLQIVLHSLCRSLEGILRMSAPPFLPKQRVIQCSSRTSGLTCLDSGSRNNFPPNGRTVAPI